MQYSKMKPVEFFREVSTEEKAREVVWRSKNGGKDFICSKSENESFYQYECEPEY